MNDLVEFLTSQEIIIVYIIAAFACLICFIVYLVEKNNENLRKKHNTKELNKLVEEIKERMPEEENKEVYEIPIIEQIEELEDTSINNIGKEEPMVIEPIDVEETVDLSEVVQEVKKYEEEELEYTSIEPDQETAKLELKKLQEQLEQEEKNNNPIDVVAAYEDEQEKSAIISLEELLVKSKEMYEANELTQYKDEGNEPISIQDLEEQVQKQATIYNEPFIIANVVPEEELQAGINEAFEQQSETIEVLHMDDMETIKEETVNPVVTETVPKRFQASPIISPIFGIERDSARDNAIALENTANYEKLDAALRTNNEFYMTMNELQGKIE